MKLFAEDTKNGSRAFFLFTQLRENVKTISKNRVFPTILCFTADGVCVFCMAKIIGP